MPPIQMLWIGPRLSNLERLSILSFLAYGHEVHLYSYGEVAGAPAGATRCDARQVLPESEVFTYASGFGKGSPASFSNFFRYQLLLDRGGMWCDADIVCLKPFDFAAQSTYVVASERRHPSEATPRHPVKLNACLLQAPAGSPVMRECRDACAAADRRTLRWGDIGPSLITRTFNAYGLAHHALPPEAICPIDWWNTHEFITQPLPDLPGSYGLHLWNEVWRHHGIDKDGVYASASAYETLKRRYGLTR